jgi:hypothetical protein
MTIPKEPKRLVEWQCPHCGAWVSDAWYRHCHIKHTDPTLGEMVAMRERGEPLVQNSEVHTYYRTGKEHLRAVIL